MQRLNDCATRAYAHRGMQIEATHSWKLPEWMVINLDNSKRSTYVETLDEARELINQELSPST